MNEFAHLIGKLGLLTSFSIAKVINVANINTFIKKCKKKKMSEQDIKLAIQQLEQEEMSKDFSTGNVPGILFNPNTNSAISDLNSVASAIANQLLAHRFSKHNLCYFINLLVNMLQLNEDDFSRFHQGNENNNE